MKDTSKLRMHAVGVAGLLVLEYILGMLTALYVEFPEGDTKNQLWQFASSQLLVFSHIILSVLILLGLLVLVIRAIQQKDRDWKLSSGIAFVSALLATFAGSQFVSEQTAGYSFAMSLFFIIALVALGWGIYKSKK